MKISIEAAGWHFPSRKLTRISCLFLCLFPSKSLIPRTSASAAVCLLELKCSATGKPGAFLLMLRRYSPKRSLRVRPVSPMCRAAAATARDAVNQTFEVQLLSCLAIFDEQRASGHAERRRPTFGAKTQNDSYFSLFANWYGF